jgi:hypothetical protein
MKHLIGIKTTYASAEGPRDSKTIINADRIDFVEYQPAYKVKIDGNETDIPQSLTIHFNGGPLVLTGRSADAVWKELKDALPQYMKVPLEDETP